ncbi:hypothetical protein HPP92_017108 [Vanilla planifolia]|uniref:Ammonium transporter AmtB-like domain-containing protein n=1 Tax=Vanilla planifolia TaxID=51239 RepID=A0A835Q7F3_VANPL|nr:hypothetical protein HPP92_017663 [Vanilla planifolia]KAG0467780.1 hypothetical protein HPP92_017108 [Vanilla planifolia]
MSLPMNLQTSETSPEWLNKGDNAWQLTAATLVGLQSIPGLVLLYSGIVKKKWAVNSAFMALYAFAAVLVCCPVGFQHVLRRPPSPLRRPTLRSLLARTNFYAWMLFVPMWLTFSYAVGAFSLWSPNGFLFKMGVMDFAGGFVIHLASGVAGLTAAYWVGPRAESDRQRFPPNNLQMMLAGAGMLWMGWSGFNGGAPYAANIDASLAVLNTHVCTAVSLLVWLCLDVLFFRKPSLIGAVQGMITGLVCITPAAGLVQGWAAMVMGVLSGSIPWFTMMVLHRRIPLVKHVDDTLAIFHTHAVAGSLGGILVGFFAEPRLNHLFFGDDPKYIGLAYALRDGRASAGFRQMGVQLLAMAFVVGVNVVVTSTICLIIRTVIPLRLEEEVIKIGDDAIHGEEAYAIWGDGEKLVQDRSSNVDRLAAVKPLEMI